MLLNSTFFECSINWNVTIKYIASFLMLTSEIDACSSPSMPIVQFTVYMVVEGLKNTEQPIRCE